MNTNAFDELIKDKFDKGEFAYNPENWNKLSLQLPDKKPWNRTSVILFLLSGIAACFTLTFTINAWLNNTSHDIKNNSDLAVTKHQQVKLRESVVRQAGIASIPAHISAAQNRAIACNQPAKKVMASKQVENKTSEITHTDIKYHEPVVVKSHALPEKNILEKTPGTNYGFEDNKVEKNEYARDNRKLSISLAGGLNYGASNNGFALGATAQKKISRKIYLEGNIAYVANNISQQQQQKSVGSYTPTSNTAASVAAPAPNTISTVSNMRYLQVTPSVGYNVLKHLSVGVGADFQQLVDNGQSNYIMQGETIKELPTLDMGIVGKTEYMVNKRLSAGVMYREAMNNALSGGGNKYFDRSYLQVQLKINVTAR